VTSISHGRPPNGSLISFPLSSFNVPKVFSDVISSIRNVTFDARFGVGNDFRLEACASRFSGHFLAATN